MNITYQNSNILSVPQGYYLATAVSGDFTLGAGVAKLLDEQYSLKRKLFRWHSKPEERMVGSCICVDNVFCLIDKKTRYDKVDLYNLTNCMYALRNFMYALDVNKVAMPKIGCGHDNLNWEDVYNIICNVFEFDNFEIMVCVRSDEEVTEYTDKYPSVHREDSYDTPCDNSDDECDCEHDTSDSTNSTSEGCDGRCWKCDNDCGKRELDSDTCSCDHVTDSTNTIVGSCSEDEEISDGTPCIVVSQSDIVSSSGAMNGCNHPFVIGISKNRIDSDFSTPPRTIRVYFTDMDNSNCTDMYKYIIAANTSYFYQMVK